jgi:hypothetical protein
MMYVFDFLSFCYFFFLLSVVNNCNCEGKGRATSIAEFISFELQSRLERWHLPFLDRIASIVIKAKLNSMESGIRPATVNYLTH